MYVYTVYKKINKINHIICEILFATIYNLSKYFNNLKPLA